MNIHAVTERLKNKGFKSWGLEEFEVLSTRINQSNLKIWKDHNRVIVVKSYSSKAHFLDWAEDQIIISYVYDVLTSKTKNNLYFLLVLSWDVKLEADLTQVINVVEKDELVCRKYAIFTNEDLERVPFLQQKDLKASVLFNYEETFKEQLKNQDDHAVLHSIIDYYFSQDHLTEEEEWKCKVSQLIVKE